MKNYLLGLAMTAAALGVLGPVGPAAAGELNLYSSRHYQTDEALYEDFTKTTGIKINRIEGKGDALIERIKAEGRNSPADVFLTVDAGRLWRADEADLFQSVSSAILEQRIPENLRHPDGKWFGFSTRARVIVTNKDMVPAGAIATYEDLADPKWKGKICIRSSSNIYNLSLLGSMIAEHGEKKAEDWARAVVANFARPPQGGDTDQIRAVASGQCALGVANTYYYIRLMISKKAEDRAVADKVEILFPNQQGRGAHFNVSGAGVLKNAPHRAAAVKFLEYLASDSAQRYFADGNNEFPVVAGAGANTAVASLGAHKRDPINVVVYGQNQALAQKIFDRAGWK